eukprot:TRINITY_DN13882_c0_g1_i1.p1 TRINITY_DN13882_c0_g1~~TRINITY_DN13882_c0_g1_i1.p1  ORF type:complete len:130 (-),score=20.33 TRINITY_DN13882_c0_g1_i1:58-447(-)
MYRALSLAPSSRNQVSVRGSQHRLSRVSHVPRVPVRSYSGGHHALTEKEAFARLRDCIRDFHKITEDQVITLDTKIPGGLNLDSLDLVELTMAIENEFDVDFPDTTAVRFKTLREIVDHLVAIPPDHGH